MNLEHTYVPLSQSQTPCWCNGSIKFSYMATHYYLGSQFTYSIKGYNVSYKYLYHYTLYLNILILLLLVAIFVRACQAQRVTVSVHVRVSQRASWSTHTHRHAKNLSLQHLFQSMDTVLSCLTYRLLCLAVCQTQV